MYIAIGIGLNVLYLLSFKNQTRLQKLYHPLVKMIRFPVENCA